jgi:hypothetical protein
VSPQCVAPPPAPARLWALILAVAGRARQTPHNLSLDGGPKTPDLKPGQKATLDAGTITKAMTGACSIPGHKEAGMTFEVHLSGMAPRRPLSTPTRASTTAPSWTPRHLAGRLATL